MQAAGEVTIEDGQIIRLTNNSGHYRPYGDWSAASAIDALKHKAASWSTRPFTWRFLSRDRHQLASFG